MSKPECAKIMSCPQCGKSIKWSSDNPHRPFCSERCKLIDLGAWASEELAIAGEPVNPWEADTSNPMDFEH